MKATKRYFRTTFLVNEGGFSYPLTVQSDHKNQQRIWRALVKSLENVKPTHIQLMK